MASTFNDGLSFNSPMSRARAELQWLTATSRLHRPAASPHRRAFTTGPAMPEALECRRLLAGIEAGILVARGTEAPDVISLRRTGTDDVIVTTNGVNQQFDMDHFTGVRLEGLGGDDRFELIDPLTSPHVRNTTVLGGAGNDTVSYVTRTAALAFKGYQAPDSSTALPFIEVTAGAQIDRVALDVENVVAGSGNDMFRVNYGGLNLDWFDFHSITLDGRGGNDQFGTPQELRATLLGGAGDDGFFADESGAEMIFGGDGNDSIALNGMVNVGFDAGAGVDTMTVHGYLNQTVDMGEFPGLENLDGAGDHVRLVTGNALNNRITASHFGDSPVTFRGLGGNDTLVGGVREDLLEGGDGNDSVVGNEGNDTIDGGAGDDTVDGGPGNNVILNAEVTPAAPNIRIVNRILTADGSWGMDHIRVERAGTDGVTIRVNNLSRTFNAADFDNIEVRGNNGFDHLEVISVPSQPFVHPVTLVGGRGNDTLEGSDADDVLLGGDRDDVLRGGGGNDSLVGAFGSDFLDGGEGQDIVDGGPGNNAIHNAEITPPPPTIGIVDRVLIADGSWGVDWLRIERTGRDNVIVRVNETSREFDMDQFDGVLLRGNSGFDYFSVLDLIVAGSLARKVTLEGGNGNDTILGSAGEEVLRGGTGHDVLRGFGGNDALFGNGGNDLLDAGGGDDFLEGADGRPFDTLFGGNGNDTALIDSGDEVSGVETFG